MTRNGHIAGIKKKEVIFTIPITVKSNRKGFDALSKIMFESKDSIDTTITLDFTFNNHFDANLCALLGAIIDFWKTKNNNVNYQNVKPKIKTIFTKNGFLTSTNSGSIANAGNVISFQKFKQDEESKVIQYLDDELLSRTDLPNMSIQLKRKINKSIFEIFNNAFTHGVTKHVYTCGQFYPGPKILDFTIVDLGHTIKRNVNKYLKNQNKQPLNSTKSIEWAVMEGHTTKTGSIPGGLGLSLIREFLKLNRGTIQIVSAQGYWKQNNTSLIHLFKINPKFEGTIVNIEFNLADRNSYILKEEIDPTSIFS